MQQNRVKTGGRLRGVPNKKTLELSQKIHQLGLDPVEGLAAILAQAATSNELKVKIYCELMPYLYPKRKVIESDGGGKQAVVFNIGIMPRSIPMLNDQRTLISSE